MSNNLFNYRNRFDIAATEFGFEPELYRRFILPANKLFFEKAVNCPRVKAGIS